MRDYMQPCKYVFGVDPGKTGALSIFSYIDGEYYLRYILDYDTDKPMIPYSIQDKVEEVTAGHCIAFIENVHAAPGQSVSAMFNFGQNLGWWKGLFDALEIEYKLIAPQSWSPVMLGITDDKKNKAREVAKNLFSRDNDCKCGSDVSPWFRLKKHDGRADSALIAWYGIQKYIK